MNSYFILWPNDWCKLLAQANGTGPLHLIYGGPHSSVPSLSKITIDDSIYPIFIKNGHLFLIGQMQVEHMMEASVYLKAQNINRLDDNLWDASAPKLLALYPNLGHRISRSCVDTVAIGSGTHFRFDLEVPVEIVSNLQFGPKPGQEKSISVDTNGKISHVQGHFRRLSAASATLIADFMQKF